MEEWESFAIKGIKHVIKGQALAKEWEGSDISEVEKWLYRKKIVETRNGNHLVAKAIGEVLEEGW